MKTKNIFNIFFIITIGIFLTGITSPDLVAGEKFAPKVKLPSNMNDRALWAPVVKNWKVPSKSEVGIPAYEGSFIVSLKVASHMTANGVKYNTLPTIILATTDDPAKVTAFYKVKLKDWKYKNDWKMFDVFWKDGKKFNSMDIRDNATRPNIIIQKAGIPYLEYMPKAKSVITIVY